MPLHPEDGWVVSSLLINAGELARARGANWAELLNKHSISPNLLTTPDNHISLRHTFEIFNELGREIRDPALFLVGFSKLPIGAADLLDYVAIFSPDAKVAANNWAHYAPLCSQGMDLSLTEDDQGLILTLDIPNRFGPNYHATIALMALMAGRLSYILGASSQFLLVEMAVAAPLRDLTGLDLGPFDGTLCFEADKNRIHIPKQFCNQPNPHADRNLLRLIETAASRLLAEVGETKSRISAIASTIAEGLQQGNHSMEFVAQSLGISQRSLQRLLEHEGTSYREVLEEVRRSTAEGYLLDTRLPIKEIAYLLGFSNISAFSRAVKSWFGLGPRDLRKQAMETQDKALLDESI